MDSGVKGFQDWFNSDPLKTPHLPRAQYLVGVRTISEIIELERKARGIEFGKEEIMARLVRARDEENSIQTDAFVLSKANDLDDEIIKNIRKSLDIVDNTQLVKGRMIK